MPTTATFITDLLDHHLDELGFLWARWRGSLRDPDYTLKAVDELEERINGHVDGVRVPGEQAYPRLIELLEGEDADLVFAAALSLLHTGSPELVARALERLDVAEEDLYAALCTALAYGPLPPDRLDRVRALLSAQPTLRAIAAAEVLAFHGALQLTGDQLRYFVEDEDAEARIAGWRLAALAGARLPPQSYSAALRDEDPGVTAAALEAGAWSGEPGTLAALRHLAESPSPERVEALRLLGVLGGPEDLPRVQTLMGSPELGPGRFRIAAAYGHPALMQLILDALEDPDAATAAAAGEAFMKMTGVDIESDTRVALPPADGSEPDEFEEEFLDEVTLPDAASGRKRWSELEPGLSAAARIARGVALSPDGGDMDLDMESRWDMALRSRSSGARPGSALDLERFPQARRQS
jgi:uncharacterized protein (TIGR02270 family)